MQTETAEAFVRWVRAHPVWVAVLVLFSVAGLFAQWASAKIFDSWFGSAPPFTITVNVEPAVNILGHIYPIASAIFLGALFIAAVHMLSDKVRGALPDQSLLVDIDFSEIVLAPHEGVALLDSPSRGIYVVIRNTRLVNRSQRNMVLSVRLRVVSGGEWWIYERIHPSPISQTGILIAGNLARLFAERFLPDPVNLDPLHGDTGNLMFRFSNPKRDLLLERLSEIQGSEMECEIDDAISGQTRRFPVSSSKRRRIAK
jgi:hypothetical protein